jgi:hypothetical protein
MTQTPGVLQSAFDLTAHCFPGHFDFFGNPWGL